MIETVIFNGTVGSGKTTVAEALGDILRRTITPHAVLDLDAVRGYWPSAPNDRFNLELTLANLAALKRNFHAAGAERLILSGVVESTSERRAYEDAVGGPVIICRLVAEPTVVRERLEQRHRYDPDGLKWHLQRASELAALLDRAGMEEFLLDATAASPREVAERARRLLHW